MTHVQHRHNNLQTLCLAWLSLVTLARWWSWGRTYNLLVCLRSFGRAQDRIPAPTWSNIYRTNWRRHKKRRPVNDHIDARAGVYLGMDSIRSFLRREKETRKRLDPKDVNWRKREKNREIEKGSVSRHETFPKIEEKSSCSKKQDRLKHLPH